MPKIEPFEAYSREYDRWFNKNQNIYLAELEAVKRFIPDESSGVEIGVGTGRFAAPLGIKVGVEPSKKMGKMAKEQGIEVYEGVAEKLPFEDRKFGFVLFVTTLCFLDDVEKGIKEARRVLKENGKIIIGFIDRNSKMWEKYRTEKFCGKFYKDATFYSAEEVREFLVRNGFSEPKFVQTVFEDKKGSIQPVRDGHGEGLFVVACANKI